MFRSATFKLTLWYLAIVMTISLVFSVVVYHFATSELSVGLSHQTQRIFDEFPVFHGNSFLKPGADVAAGSHHILWRLVYFNFLVLVLAGIASYFLARQTLEPIEAAHERQKRFTADVSHELRTPLTSLKMGSEVALMDKQANKEELRAALESNLEDAAKMNLLINNLLRLTRLDADEVQATVTGLGTKALTEAATAQVQKIADLKHITIKNEAADRVVQGDQDSLTQLLVILLDNAIKYSPEKAVVQLKTTAHDGQVQISVHDAGQGIAPDKLPYVFDRFYRADKSRTKTTTDGFGLGLSIAKLITDRHRGTITLTSRLGHGTTATVSLPVNETSAS